MAGEDFDFSAFKAQKFAEYKKKEIKPAVVRKAKGGIIFTDYKMAGKKIPCIFIPMKKVPEALKLFKQVKASKEHILKKTALVSVLIGKAEDGSEKITLEIKKGGLSRDFIIQKGQDLFETTIKMKLEVLGGADGVADAVADAIDGAAEVVEDAAEAVAETAQEVANRIKGMIKSVADAMKNQVSSTVVPNVKKKEVTDEDKDIIDNVMDTINDLSEAFEGAEDRIKNALQAHYDKIMGYKPKVEKIKSAVESLWDSVSDAVSDAFEQAADWMNDTLSEDAQKATEQLAETAREALNAFSGEDVNEPVEEVPNPILEEARRFMERTGSAVNKAASSVASSLSNVESMQQESQTPDGADFLNDL